MLAEEGKKKIIETIGYKIKFEKHFDSVFNNIDENKQNTILSWIKSCVDGNEPFLRCKINQNWLAFVFKSNYKNLRAILVKEKNAFFLVLYLSHHKYYEQKRKELGI